jgi:mevalonate kinase
MVAMKNSYPAKLLLFGEYTVLSGSQALAVPLYHWSGRWVETSEKDSKLKPYFEWLADNSFIDDVTFQRMIDDIQKGIQYQSDIPIGYGVGSSGALVAAVYDRYFERQAFSQMSSTLAGMESYFHGSSSGMDPLVSLTGKAVYRDDLDNVQLMDDPGWPEGVDVYLLDSGRSRETAPLVNKYKEYISVDHHLEKIRRELIPMVDHAIHAYMLGENKLLEDCISLIGDFQKEHFQMLIPEEVKTIWDELSAEEGIYMKLCGAGGGGYYLILDLRFTILDLRSTILDLRSTILDLQNSGPGFKTLSGLTLEKIAQ